MPLKKKRASLENHSTHYTRPESSQTPYDVVWDEKDRTVQKSPVKRGGFKIWGHMRDRIAGIRMRATFAGIFVISAVFLLASLLVLVMLFGRGYFVADRVHVSIEVPDEVTSGKDVEMIVHYRNDNRATLDDVVVSVDYGQYFQPHAEDFIFIGDHTIQIDVGSVDARSVGEVRIPGSYSGPRDELESVDASFVYNVKNRLSDYEITQQKIVRIVDTAISLDILGSQEVVSGDVVDVRIIYRNTGTIPLSDAQVVVQAPESFQFIDSNPQYSQMPDESFVWDIDNLDAFDEGEVLLRGVVSGSLASLQPFRSTLRVADSGEDRIYATDEHTYIIVETPLTIEQYIIGNDQGVVQAGDVLDYEIVFTNTGRVPLRNITMEAAVRGDVVDDRSFSVDQNGYYDVGARVIQWKAVSVPQLEILNPGESGTVRYQVRLKDRIGFEGDADRNQSVMSRVQAHSDDFPDIIVDNKDTFSNVLSTKLSTKPLLEVSAVSGVTEIDQESRADLFLRIGTVNNDLNNVRLEGFVGQGITLGDVRFMPGFSFNADSNRFVWEIDRMPAGTGVASPFLEQVLPISFVLRGKNATLLQDIVLSGTDAFTGQSIKITQPRIDVQSIQ